MGLEEYARVEIASGTLGFAVDDFENEVNKIQEHQDVPYEELVTLLEEPLKNIYEGSCLRGQYVSVKIHSDEIASGATYLDYTEASEPENLNDASVLGTIVGFYVHTEIVRSSQDDKVDSNYHDPVIVGEFEGIPLYDDDEVIPSLGIRIKPLYNEEDDESVEAFYEIPYDTIESIAFPDIDHPLIVDGAVFSELRRQIETIEDDQDTGLVKKHLLDEHVDSVNVLSPLIGKVLMLLVEDDITPFAIKINNVVHAIDFPVLHKISGTFMGLTVKKVDDIDSVSLHAEIVARSELQEEVIQIPIDSIVAGVIDGEQDLDEDQGLLNSTVDHFYSIIDDVLIDNPFDHESAIERAANLCEALNDGATIMEDRRTLSIKLNSSAYYEFADIEPDDGSYIVNISEAPHVLRPGTKHWLDCEIVYYYFEYTHSEDDTEMQSDDFRLMAVVDPKNIPRGLFEGNALVVDLADVTYSRFAVENYN